MTVSAPERVRSEGDRPLPVLPALEPLFAAGGLRRGSAVAVRGSASLLLAVLAGPARGGAWCGVVGMPALGLLAAAEAGIPLERLALVPDPGRDWASVVAALLDAMEIVVVAPGGRPADGEVRRLAARARQRGAVLVPYGGVAWPGAELRLSVTAGRWTGVGGGWGNLRSRRVVVHGEGRGSAARGQDLPLWLPAPDGEVRPADHPLRVLPGGRTAATPPTDLARPPRPAPTLPPADLPPAAVAARAVRPAPGGIPRPAPGPGDAVRPAALRSVPGTGGGSARPGIGAGAFGPRPAGAPVPAGRSSARAGVPATSPKPAPPPASPGAIPLTTRPASRPARARTPDTPAAPARPGGPVGSDRPGGSGADGSTPRSTGPDRTAASGRPGRHGEQAEPGVAGRPGTAGAGRARPGIPAALLARLRPASALPRPPGRGGRELPAHAP
jgi:hypothetical protein